MRSLVASGSPSPSVGFERLKCDGQSRRLIDEHRKLPIWRPAASDAASVGPKSSNPDKKARWS